MVTTTDDIGLSVTTLVISSAWLGSAGVEYRQRHQSLGLGINKALGLWVVVMTFLGELVADEGLRAVSISSLLVTVGGDMLFVALAAVVPTAARVKKA